MPTTPTPTDFPSPLRPSLLLTPPPTQPARSILLLLHGLGDTHLPFHTLGRQLSLPHTATLSLRGPSPLPALFMGTDTTGFHWGDDVLLDQSTGAVDFDAGFSAAARELGQVLEVLLGACGFEARDVYVLGFGQGGMVALGMAEAFGACEFGGVIAIGSKLPALREAMAEARGLVGALAGSASVERARTPVLLCGGRSGTQVTQGTVGEAKRRFEGVEYVKWEREGDGMPGNRAEMLPVMRFLARRLRMAVPEGMEEVGGGA